MRRLRLPVRAGRQRAWSSRTRWPDPLAGRAAPATERVRGHQGGWPIPVNYDNVVTDELSLVALGAGPATPIGQHERSCSGILRAPASLRYKKD